MFFCTVKGLRYILIPVLLLGIILGSIVYSIYRSDKPIEVWTLIPDHALIVVELKTEKLLSLINDKEPKPSTITLLPNYEVIRSAKLFIDSILMMDSSKAISLSDESQLYVSIHESAKQKLGTLYFIPLKEKSLEFLLSYLKNNSSFPFRDRIYLRDHIYEARLSSLGTVSVTAKKGWLILSQESLLIEDVIRTAEKKSDLNFKNQHKLLFSVAERQSHDLRVYVLMEKFSQFLRKLELKEVHLAHSLLASMAYADANLENNEWQLTGYLQNSAPNHFLKHLQINKPVTPEIWPLVPASTHSLEFFGFNSGFELYYQLLGADTSNAYLVSPQWKVLRDDLNFEPLAMIETFDNQCCLLHMLPENQESGTASILITKVDREASERAMLKLENQISLLRKDTTYFENFQQYTIRQLDYQELPSKLLGSVFKGFDECFYVYHDSFLVFSSSIIGLKKWIVAIEDQTTWERDIFYRSFTESSVSKTNYFHYTDPMVWFSALAKKEETPIVKWVKEHQSQLESLRHFSFQISFNPGVVPYFGASLLIDTTRKEVPKTISDQAERIISLPQALVGKPMIYKVGNRNPAVFVSDSLGGIYKLSDKGEIVWTYTTGSPMESNLHLIERGPYAGGILYLSKGKIVGLNAEGLLLEGYPITPEHLIPVAINLIDYDNSGTYRIAIADNKGNAMLTDFAGKGLEGWDPVSYEHRLIAAPQHLRIKGKDFIICITTRGLIHVYNRRGEIQKGFPLDLGANFLSKPMVRTGSGLSNSTINLISELGEYYRVTLDGKILMKEVLMRANRFSQFKLIPSQSKENWVVCRANLSTLTFFNENAAVKLESELPLSGDPDYQYFETKAGKYIIAVIDQESGLSYLIDNEGRMLGLPTYEKASGFDIFLQNKILTLYFNQGNNLRKVDLSYD